MNSLTGAIPQSFDQFGLEAPFSPGSFSEDPQSAEEPGPWESPVGVGYEGPIYEGPIYEGPVYEGPFTELLDEAGAPGTASGRLVVDKHPMLRAHRGTAPDLILRWNAIAGPGEIDVVVHFHGYSGKGAAMRIDRQKEPDSGLDFADPTSPTTSGRSRPTLGILPRGNHFGGKSGAGYNFPALTPKGALDRLIDDALARLGQETGHAFQRGRLILTGHSGGGAPVNAVLAHTDPDEVEVFDGMYGSGANIVRWAERRIARELASPGAQPPALRILYIPNSGTQAHSEAVLRGLCKPLATPGAERLRAYFRVDRTSVAHGNIPRRFGWRLLADAAADLPGATTRPCAPLKSREAFAEASPYWQPAPNEREESELESSGMTEQESWLAESGPFGESLAWLDVEAPTGSSTESPYVREFEDEDESSYGRDSEAFEAFEAFDAFEAAESPYIREFESPYVGETGAFTGEREQALEHLIDSEAGVGTGLADRIKGVAAFVLGPSLQRGSDGVAVAALQRALVALGYDIAVDGKFGPGTERAVKAFQTAEGQTADGVVTPRTAAAIAAALARKASPLPSPSPSPLPSPSPAPQPTASSLADAIVRIAEEEYRRWHPRPGVDLKETNTAATPILQQYYRVAVNQTVAASDLQSAAWQAKHYWSAVFISYVMRTAGAGKAFAYSRAHRVYIGAAKRNRLRNVTTNPFWAYRADEVAPQLGDLICNTRAGENATYDNIDNGTEWPTHCDIVTEIRPGKLRVIGGNVRDDVNFKTIAIHPDGRLKLEGKQKVYFAVLRCRGPIGSTTPGPTPQPPAPGPSPSPTPPPSGKLPPAQFVATYGPSARASEAKSGVPALVTLGQAALESGWGGHAPRFNFFGIKAKASDPEPTRQLLRTREVCRDRNCKFPEIISITPRADGKFDYVVRDWFRAYPDAATAFEAHGQFLVRNKRYSKAFTVAHDPYAFAAEVARAGYATDPSYEKVLTGVMKRIEAIGGF